MNKEENNETKKDFFTEFTGKILTIFGLISLIVGTVIFIILGSWNFSTILDEAKIGQFGDFIGGVIGSVFALAGVILYYVALKEQRREIKVSQNALECQVEALNLQVEEFRSQSKEMQETRKIYDEQTKEFKRQTDIAKLQQFDSSFYSLLDVLINLKKELNKNDDYFSNLYSRLKEENLSDTLFMTYQNINKKCIELFYENHSKLSLYFKTIYRIIKLIDSSSIENAEKYDYFKIFRSQISSCELLILYYNYHSNMGLKVRPYVIKYDLLKHISAIDKIEFDFKGDNYQKSITSDFFYLLKRLLTTNFQKYNDIEATDDVSISEQVNIFDIEAIISLEINTDFILTIAIDKNELGKQGFLCKETIKKYVTLIIYDVFFLSKFKVPNNEIVEFEYTDREKHNCYDYRFLIKNMDNIEI